MSSGLANLAPTEDDISKMIMAQVHIGANNVDFQMKGYIYKRKPDGFYIVNIRKTWEKILLAARILVTIDNPKDICAISGRPYGQRAVFKFAAHTGATPVAGRFTPGTFTNQIQRAFQEPRILIVTDPRSDHQPITEAAYSNIPVVGFCNTDSPIRYIDIVIPGNNKSIHSIGLLWWMLAREYKRFKGQLQRTAQWEIMPDLYFYRDPEEIEKEEAQASQREYDAPQTNQWQESSEAAPATEEASSFQQTTTTTTTATSSSGNWGGSTSTEWSSSDWNASQSWGAGK